VQPPEITLENKIFPNAVGYGTDSRGAYGGQEDPQILIVDTLDPGNFSTGENRGTLTWAVRQEFPRIIVYEVSGVIDYTGTDWRVQIESPYVNIYGQTAPGKGVTLKGAVFWVQTHDVLVQHLKVRPGDLETEMDPNDVDAVNFYHGATDVVFDHCSFSWSIDELVSSKDTNENITFSNTIFGEALDRSWHHDNGMPERHPYAALMYAGNTTFYRNLFAYTFGRNPLIRQGGNHVINNLNYTSLHSGTMVENIGFEVQAAIVGNHVINVPFDGQLSGAGDHAVYVVNNHDPDSQIFVEDNLCQRAIDEPSISDWETVYNRDRIAQADSSPVDISEFDVLPSSDVEGHVLANAGAFFWNRDTTDATIVEKVENRAGGQMRHSVEDYPATARNLETTATTGDVSGGYDWGADPQTLVISYNETSGGDVTGPVTVELTANCEDITDVVDHLNSVLPDGLEAARMNEVVDLNLVEIHTTHAGDGAFIEIHDDSTAAETLGIEPGEFRGYSYDGYDTEADAAPLTLPDNPHADPDGNSYTNLEEWAWLMGLGL
jgi:pectate lyase